MFQYICDWMQRIAYYLVIVTAMLHMIPGEEYRRFVRFFTGLILVLLMAGPLLRLFDGTIDLNGIYDPDKYQTEIENVRKFMEQKETSDSSSGETSEIHVEEIRVGR